MRIVNRTRGTVLAERAEKALSWKRRLQGLLGKDGLEKGEGLFIAPCTSIHSCFMRFVFDAVFVDRELKVLHLIKRMRPWRISRWVRRARGVIELPAGTISATGTREGDRLRFEE